MKNEEPIMKPRANATRYCQRLSSHHTPQSAIKLTFRSTSVPPTLNPIVNSANQMAAKL